MNERDLKRLRRSDLLEMLLALTRENEDLRSQLEQANSRLADRTISIQNTGSLAEAALQLNGVFEAAQAACDQYLLNIRQRSENIERVCSQMEEETRQKCEKMLADARLKAASLAEETLPELPLLENLGSWLEENEEVDDNA